MSKYVESNLIRDEKIVLKAKINPLALLKDFVICAVIIAIGIVVKVMVFSNAGESGEQIGTYVMLAFIAVAVIKFLIAFCT